MMTDKTATNDQSTPPILSKKRKRNPTSSPRKPREKPVQCPVCLTARSPNLILDPLACNCIYCVPCIREVFSISLQSENRISSFPAQCCGKVLDHILLESSLTPQLRRAYKSKAEEEASNDPLYCGNPECGAFILEASIKDDFGSCGKCRIKTCAKNECSKTKAEHLGIHAICPEELETEELRMLAEEKGWKRCPKCYALTERSRGCNDIRCFCRTEWCYKCGKTMKGNKDVCLCYPARAPLPVQPTQDDVQVQREIIVLQDEDGNDTNMVDVKPSIEEIEASARSIFYTESDLIAEFDRHTNRGDQPDVHDPMAQPETCSQNDHDIMQELDTLAAPNARTHGNPLQRTSEIHTTNPETNASSAAREPILDGFVDNLEDMLHAYNSYRDPSPAHSDETSDPPPVPTQAEKNTVMEHDTEWLMDSIEEYLGIQGSSITNESRAVE